MNNRIRFAPPGPRGEILAEITQRTLMGFFLLKPSKRLNLIIAGVLAKAQQKIPVKIIALSFMSNHYHLLVSCKNHQQLSSFMNFFSSNLAREAGRLHGWRGRLWARRFTCIPISDEEKAQVARLKYVLEQGCKEGLVSSPRHWPGLNGVRELLSGRPLQGTWVDRTGLYRARRKGPGKGPRKGRKPVRAIDFEESLSVELAPLPCWAHLTPEQYQAQLKELVRVIEEETATRHQTLGTRVRGRRAVLQDEPLHYQELSQPSPSPLVHASSKDAREAFLAAYRLFSKAYREAAEKLRGGDLGARFPPGSFPPALPFVKHLEAS